jgi:predicted DNA-binding antitoxin AbrB/MazE fold protein
MDQRIDAIFENGVFRPEVPVNLANGERVSLSVESRKAAYAPSLDEVRELLSAFTGSLADRISEERDER